MTLSEYLDRYKALINKYFDDTEAHAEERAKALHDFLNELKGYYDSAISGVTTLLDYKISAITKQRDAAVEAAEKEKKAALDAIQAQIDAIDDLIDQIDDEIKAKEKAIDALEKEKEKIQEANAERERQINLQKSLYDLERAQQQRTQLIYKGNQLVYAQDTDSIRDAKKAVDDAETDIKIAEIDKRIAKIQDEIDMLNEQKEAYQDQQEALRKQMEETEKFYDEMIQGIKDSFQEMIDQLEKTKEKWERLMELDKIASAWSDVGQIMETLGFTVNDVLNDTPGAFEAFEQAYIATLSGLNNGNDQYLQGLADVTGKTVEELKAMGAGVTEISSDVKEPLSDIADSVEKLGSNASSATSGVSNLASSAGDLKEQTTGTADNVQKINDNLSSVDPTKLDPLRDALKDINTLINGGEEGTGGLLGALNGLNDQVDLTGVIDQFTNLKGAVDGVVSALGGGGGEESNTPLSPNNGPGGSNPTGGSGGEGGGGAGLTGAIEAVKQSADTNIGTAVAEEGGEGDGTVIGDFGALTTSINNASTAIGTSESAEESEDLIGSITALGLKDTEVLMGGDQGEGMIGEWESFNEQLSEAEGHITAMVEGLENLQESYDTTLTVTLEIEGGGQYTGTATVSGGHARYSFNVLEAIGLPGEGGTWESLLKGGKAKFTGTANMNGNWGFEGGKTLISELGPELVVYPNGTFETFDRPQVVDLPRGSIIFNHLQTDEILNPNNQITRKGKSNLNGTVSNLIPYSLSNPEQYAQFMQLADALKSNTEDMRVDLSDIDDMTRDIQRSITNSTYNSMNQNANITFGNLNFTCTGITSADVLSEVGNALEKEFSGIALNAYKKAMAH